MTEIERALVTLGRELDVPQPPDLAVLVLEQLEPREEARVPRSRRLWVVAVAAALLAALTATLAIPPARSTLLRVLHLGSERIELVDRLPSVPAVFNYALPGRPVTLQYAQRTAGFRLRVFDRVPDRVYLGPRGTVWYLYGTPTRVRLLVAQTPRYKVERGLTLKKLVAPDTRVEAVSIAGSPGLFLSGSPHVVLMVDAKGAVVADSVRLARNVLIWDDGKVTYRLEGDFSRGEALEIAASLR